MPRYFLEVKYSGALYSGFQVQKNAVTVQSVLEDSMAVYFRDKISLTGSSRTDAGVHALQNYFHFDREEPIPERFLYNINAILPPDIAILSIIPVNDEAHCRFDAVGREYKYFIYRHKDPFLEDRAFYFPYKLDMEKLNQAAAVIMSYNDFTSFSKRNTQVKTFICQLTESKWVWENECLIYNVKGNRFLRGMVRALAATMLKVGRGKLSLEEFHNVIQAKDCTKASFSVPAHGLFLISVDYPADYFSK